MILMCIRNRRFLVGHRFVFLFLCYLFCFYCYCCIHFRLFFDLLNDIYHFVLFALSFFCHPYYYYQNNVYCYYLTMVCIYHFCLNLYYNVFVYYCYCYCYYDYYFCCTMNAVLSDCCLCIMSLICYCCFCYDCCFCCNC